MRNILPYVIHGKGNFLLELVGNAFPASKRLGGAKPVFMKSTLK